MPAFIAAANPTFSRFATRRTAPPNRSGTAREASCDALSTRIVSQDTPRCATADPRETGRSVASSLETTTMETSGVMRLDTPEGEREHREIGARALRAGARHVAAKRQQRQAQDHALRQQDAVRQARRKSVAVAAIAKGVAVEDGQEARIAE